MRGATIGKQTLSRSALKTCRARKHLMSRVSWQHIQSISAPPGYGYWRGNAHCLHCPATITLLTLPAPNQTNISGDALALNCPASR